MAVGRNEAWDELSPKGKRMLMESLPVPMPLAIAGLIALIAIPPYLKTAFFPEFDNTLFLAIQMLAVVIYMLWLIASSMYNYKQKTGRLLNEDVEKEFKR